MLELVAASWSGPISLALYASDPDTVRFLQFYAASALLSARCNIGVHVVYAEGEFFPINFLRNVALRQAVYLNYFIFFRPDPDWDMQYLSQGFRDFFCSLKSVENSI